MAVFRLTATPHLATMEGQERAGALILQPVVLLVASKLRQMVVQQYIHQLIKVGMVVVVELQYIMQIIWFFQVQPPLILE